MKRVKFKNVLRLSVLLCCLKTISACSTSPMLETVEAKNEISAQNFQDKRSLYAQEIELSDFNLGLSLSGGGTRSASFSMGVLAGLADETPDFKKALNENDASFSVLQQLDYLSTVSGGGYTGYWYISKLFEHYDNSGFSLESSKSLFEDCYPTGYGDGFTLYKGSENYFYDNCRSNVSRNNRDYMFQTQVVQQSDLLFHYQDSAALYLPYAKAKATRFGEWTANIGMQLLSIPLHNVFNSLFNAQLEISPIEYSYRKGIERTFGLAPIDLTHTRVDDKKYANSDSFLWMPNFATKSFTFRELASHTRDSRTACSTEQSKSGNCFRLPIWIINTTAAQPRNLCSVFAENEKNVEHIFENTPFSFGSDLYGYVNSSFDQMYVQRLVQLYVAALDNQFESFTSPFWTSLIHLANLNLGASINNYNQYREPSLLNYLPFPLYCINSVNQEKASSNIYLSDGGHSENTGAYALIKRGVKNIIISDATFDPQQNWDDLKKLATTLKQNHGLTLTLEGEEISDPRFDPCQQYVDCNGEKRKLLKHIFEGQVDGFDSSFLGSNDKKVSIKVFYIKTGLVEKYINENCENPNYYPCSVYRFFINNRDVDFPHHSTERTAANFSQSIYFAYRDLGRFISTKLYLDKQELYRFTTKEIK